MSKGLQRTDKGEATVNEMMLKWILMKIDVFMLKF
jgi:hypothetical protein